MRIETQSTGTRETKATQPDPTVSASISHLPASGRQETADKGIDAPVDGAANDAVNTRELNAAVAHINDYVQNVQRTLQFSVDDNTGTTVVKVLDSETDEVIRQFPPEEALALARHLQASQETQAQDNSGLILHARA